MSFDFLFETSSVTTPETKKNFWGYGLGTQELAVPFDTLLLWGESFSAFSAHTLCLFVFFFFFEYKQRLFKIYSHTNNTLSRSLTRSVLLCLSISRVALAQRRRGPFATKYYIIFHSFSVLLHLQPQPFHGRLVLCRIFLRQVLLQSPALAEQHLQASLRGVVFSVRL